MKIGKLILPLGFVALASVTMRAQSIPALSDLNSENPGDLVLGFSNSSVSNDLVVDVGPASDYYTPATALTLTGSASNGTLTGGVTYTVSAYNPADLSTVFGSNASSSSTFWTVAGGNGADGGPLGSTPGNTLWVSAPSSLTINRASNTSQQLLSGNLDGMTNAMLGGGNAAGGTFASNDAMTFGPPGPKQFSLNLANNNFNYYPGNVVGNTGGSSSSLILYELQPTSSGTAAGVDLGTFTLTAGGLTFTAFTAIPEPSTYAAILGALTVGFVLIRRRSQAASHNAIV